jgi:hypothetical protein
MIEKAIVAGKPLSEWDGERVRLEGGLRRPHPEIRHLVGAFLVLWNNEVMYVGCGTEFSNRGLMKRLTDFTRECASNRNYFGGQLVAQHHSIVDIEVIVTGADRNAARIAIQLTDALRQHYRPAWNDPRLY